MPAVLGRPESPVVHYFAAKRLVVPTAGSASCTPVPLPLRSDSLGNSPVLVQLTEYQRKLCTVIRSLTYLVGRIEFAVRCARDWQRRTGELRSIKLSKFR